MVKCIVADVQYAVRDDDVCNGGAAGEHVVTDGCDGQLIYRVRYDHRFFLPEVPGDLNGSATHHSIFDITEGLCACIEFHEWEDHHGHNRYS